MSETIQFRRSDKTVDTTALFVPRVYGNDAIGSADQTDVFFVGEVLGDHGHVPITYRCEIVIASSRDVAGDHQLNIRPVNREISPRFEENLDSLFGAEMADKEKSFSARWREHVHDLQAHPTQVVDRERKALELFFGNLKYRLQFVCRILIMHDQAVCESIELPPLAHHDVIRLTWQHERDNVMTNQKNFRTGDVLDQPKKRVLCPEIR